MEPIYDVENKDFISTVFIALIIIPGQSRGFQLPVRISYHNSARYIRLVYISRMSCLSASSSSLSSLLSFSFSSTLVTEYITVL